MGARVLSDGASVTNHFSFSASPWVSDANAISVSGLGDEIEVIDGPDGRGYLTGKVTKRELTVVIADHEPEIANFNAWKEACENGAPTAIGTGTINRMDAGDNVIQTWELERCFCKMVEGNDMQLDSAEVGQLTYTITYFRAKLIGP